MNSVALALLTFGVCLATLLVAVVMGEVIYRSVRPRFLDMSFAKGTNKGEILKLGEVDVSGGVEALMESIGRPPVTECLERHQLGDWGDIDDENRQLNSVSLEEGGSFGFESAYTMENGAVLRILTFEESSGTILLTEEEYQAALLSMDEENTQAEEGALLVRPLRAHWPRKNLPKES